MKRICVYCGSSEGNRPEYKAAARALGQAMLKKGIGLVYGGAQVGIMGEIADTVVNGGGKVIGIMPKSLADREIFHTGLTELKRVLRPSVIFFKPHRDPGLRQQYIQIPAHHRTRPGPAAGTV